MTQWSTSKLVKWKEMVYDINDILNPQNPQSKNQMVLSSEFYILKIEAKKVSSEMGLS